MERLFRVRLSRGQAFSSSSSSSTSSVSSSHSHDPDSLRSLDEVRRMESSLSIALERSFLLPASSLSLLAQLISRLLTFAYQASFPLFFLLTVTTRALLLFPFLLTLLFSLVSLFFHFSKILGYFVLFSFSSFSCYFREILDTTLFISIHSHYIVVVVVVERFLR